MAADNIGMLLLLQKPVGSGTDEAVFKPPWPALPPPPPLLVSASVSVKGQSLHIFSGTTTAKSGFMGLVAISIYTHQIIRASLE